MTRLLTLIILSAAGVASQTVAGPELLARIRQHIRPSVIDLPNYTCLETVELTNYATNGQLELRERLHLDVLVAEANELFAWPGSAAFRPLGDWMGGRGAIFNGDLWIELYNLFVASVSTVRYAGMEAVGQRSLQRFDFDTPMLSSRYTLTIQGKSATVAYSGSFWVDGESLDLVRLETHAEEIPSYLDCREDHRSVAYGRVHLDVGERLLPSVAALSLVSRDGRASRGSVSFSDCRHYAVETSLSFDTSDKLPASSATRTQPDMELPSGVSLALRLEQPISVHDSAAGDPVVARLDKTVTSGVIRLPKGTRVSGRIRHLEQHFQHRQTSTLVALQFFVAEGPNGRIKFRAHLIGPRASSSEVKMVDNMPEITPGKSGLDIEDNETETGVGSFHVSGRELRLPRGFRTIWETE
jgi:hypothetical protein